MNTYYERRRDAQKRWINEIQKSADEVSASAEFRSNGGDAPIALTKVPFFDVELVGVPALNYVGNTVFKENESFSQLMTEQGKFFTQVLYNVSAKNLSG